MLIRRLAVSLLVFAAPLALAGHPVAPALRFDYTPQEIAKLCADAQAELKSALDKVGSQSPSGTTFESTVLTTELATAAFSNRTGPVTFLKDVAPDKAVRDAADQCNDQIQSLFVDLFARADLYASFKAFKEKGTHLAAEDALLLEEYLSSFRRNGLELPEAQRAVFIEKKKRIVADENEFNKNIAEWKDELLVTEKSLDGLPATYVSGLDKAPDGRYRITLDYPHYYPFMENARDAQARRDLEVKFNNRGGDRNRALLEDAIRLRHETATMLGYPTHAAFVLEKRMAKTPEAVRAFLARLTERLVPKGKAELEELLALKRQEEPGATEILAGDWRYYDNQLRKKKFDVDTQAIKEYFPIEVVLKGMFEIYQTMLGVTFVPVDGGPIWHPSVRLYRIERSGTAIAWFYMDLYPRAGKYSHAAAFTLVNGYQDGDRYVMPVASIVANLNPPNPGAPSLLEHSEVETLFHEFGHIMHQTLTRARYATFSGTSVKTDFVEAPSQMLENWVWQPESLAKLSGHYKDPSKPLPAEMVQKLVSAKLLDVGLKTLRQLTFGTVDLAYHTSPSVDSTAVWAKIAKDVSLIAVPSGTLPQSSFGHLMGGYDAGYYGYLWSQVYAADMFTRFKAEGLLSPKTGADYLKWILEPGGTVDPYELVKGFLGREPNEEAFLKGLGLGPR